jgi:glycosyltransferase involved in cell wall biosynthesis
MYPNIHFFGTATTGGAGIAAQRLYESLQGYPAQFSFFTLQNFQPTPPTSWRKWTHKISQSLYYYEVEKYFLGRPAGVELFSPAKLPLPTPPKNLPQLFHLHWVNSLIDVPSFFSAIPRHLPIVWTLHDCNTFTGGCHYTNGCKNYESQCKNCPQLGTYQNGKLALEGQIAKYEALKDKNLHIITPTKWLQGIAEKSFVLQNAKSFQTISNGIDTDKFFPVDKNTAKKALQLPENEFVICFGAEKISTQRKGLHLLVQVLALLQQQNIKFHLLTFGKNHELPTANYPHTHLGEVNSVTLQRLMYAVADILVVPSLEDNQPLTCMEAQTCGTPVAAFAVGGLPEMIIDQHNGILVPPFDLPTMAQGLAALAQSPVLCQKMGANARQYALKHYAAKAIAEKHWTLYQQLL